MPKKSYARSERVELKVPRGVYDDIMDIMKGERFHFIQDFILIAIEEKIERFKEKEGGAEFRRS